MKAKAMNYRMFSMAALAVTMFVSSPAWAAKANTHDGRLVSVSGNQLVTMTKNGKERSHTLTADAKVTCDGIVCMATDLKAGTKIRVTTKNDDNKVATQVEAIDKDANFAHTYDGKFISIQAGRKLAMTNSNGKELSYTLTADATMTCDGIACKVEQLIAGLKIRVTTKPDDPSVAVHVEAIDKDTEFLPSP